jgi:hypothetical protein
MHRQSLPGRRTMPRQFHRSPILHVPILHSFVFERPWQAPLFSNT